MEYRKLRGAARWIAAASIAAAVPAAYAQTPPPAAAPAPRRHRAPPAAEAAAAAAAPPSGLWIDRIQLSAQFDVGFIANPLRPDDGLNFGQLFTDHANQVQINQILLTAYKLLDPKNPDYQWGFKVQFMYGSDARYTQFLGELNRVDPRPALPARRGRGERPGASALAHRRRHRPEGRASIRRRSATRRSIPRPIRSTRTPTSSSSACRSSTPAR